MSRRSFNVAECGPPDPILVCYPGSDTVASLLAYIICLHGRVPEKYKLWSLNAQGVRKVHPFARVRIFDDFTEDTFRTTFLNSRRCRVLHLSDEDRWTAVSSLSASPTSLRTVLWTSSLLKISSLILGANILLWSGLLSPIIPVDIDGYYPFSITLVFW